MPHTFKQPDLMRTHSLSRELGQAYPGSKMASFGADWQTNYKTQFKWFISYCEQRYGGIVAAYNYWIAHNNY